MPLTEGAYSVLSQIPLAGIVVVVVIVFLYYLDKWLKAERESRTSESQSIREFLSEERKQNADFLREQREANGVTIGRLADKIESIAKEVASLHGTLSAHEARSQERSKGKA
jgi:hypothetical protein